MEVEVNLGNEVGARMDLESRVSDLEVANLETEREGAQ